MLLDLSGFLDFLKGFAPGRSRTGALEQHKLCGQRASRRGSGAAGAGELGGCEVLMFYSLILMLGAWDDSAPFIFLK